MDARRRRGRDVFKALALGAKAVMVGRPLIWGLAAAGEAGAAKVLRLLRDELQTCMQLCGTACVEHIDASFVLNRAKL